MRLPKRPEQWIMLGLVTLMLVLTTRQVAKTGIDDHIKTRIRSNDIADDRGPVKKQARPGRTTFLALGDVAKCKPVNLYGYVRLGVNYVINSHVASYGEAEGAEKTANLVAQIPDAEILGLGDLVYPHGSLFSYRHCFDKYFNAAFDRFHPVPGNHDYKHSQADGYFDYWGARAGSRGKGYYSMDRGSWHIVALNSELEGESLTAQLRWLRADLSRTSSPCVLAYFHRPAFSARGRSGEWTARMLFRVLYNHGATVILNGHNHFYERTAPIDAAGRINHERGVRTFIVGTGGGKMPYSGQRADFTQVLISKTWGILKLDLEEQTYRWSFLSTPLGEVRDSGVGGCVNRQTAHPITAQRRWNETPL